MAQKTNQEVSNFALTFGIWYTNHKIFLKKIFIFSFIAFIIILYFFNISTTFKLFIVDKNTEKNVLIALFNNPIGTSFIQQRFKPEDILIQGINVIPKDSNMSDIIGGIFNSNNEYYAKEIFYRVFQGTNILVEGETYLWPLEKRFIVIYNIPEVHSSDSVNIQIYRVVWKRMEDYKKVQYERANFPVQMKGFAPSRIIFGDKFIPASVKFTIENRTIYNYWDVGISLILYNGANVAGAAFTQLSTFRSLEKIPIDMKILTNSSMVTNVEIFPEINILDNTVYLKDDDTVGEPK